MGTDARAGSSGGRKDESPAGDAVAGAEQAGREAADSRAFGALVTGGLITYGGVHLVIAWLFLQVAWSTAGSANRPITAMSRTVAGQVVLWAAALGMAILVLWRVAQTLLRPGGSNTRQRVVSSVTRLFEAVVYALIAVSAVQAALTRGRKGSVQGEGRSEQSLGATLLAHVWGRVIVMAIAVAFLALAIELFRSAITRSFADDLVSTAPRAVLWAGAAGTFTKGVAVVIISGLLAWAAVTYAPAKTGGLEAMIRTLRSQPFGPALLTLMAAGLALFGVYCFAWSAHARR